MDNVEVKSLWENIKSIPPPKDLGCISFDKICDKFYLDYFS